MRLLLTFAALTFTALTASATIVIYEGPAPMKDYGAAENQKRNHAYLVVETETSRAQLINFYSPGNKRDFEVLEAMTMFSGTIPGANGSTTVATGTITREPQPTDFDTIVLSFRGKNSKLSNSPALIYPRVLTGVYRRTTKALGEISHIEQRFTLKHKQVITGAANRNGDTLEEAVQRVITVLENRRFTAEE
jgi:hypothetical protein